MGGISAWLYFWVKIVLRPREVKMIIFEVENSGGLYWEWQLDIFLSLLQF
jgi:hypothetical protein